MKASYSTLLIFLFASSSLLAQKHENATTLASAYDQSFSQLHYWEYKLPAATDTALIKDILFRELNLNENDQLRVADIQQSKSATHIRFNQFYNNTEVFGGGAKVAVSRNNVLFRCSETVINTSGNLGALPTSIDNTSSLKEFQNVAFTVNKPVYLWNGQQVIPGWYSKFTHNQNGYDEMAWLANGDLFFHHDLNLYFQDSTVNVKVFDPDPISPISQVYGGIYVDDNDGNQTVLDPLRIERQVKATFEDNVFKLKNDYVTIKEFSNPVNIVYTSATPNFDFSRSHVGFEQVNAFYHITKFKEYLLGLGYSVVNYSISVDPNGFVASSDNSAFSTSNKTLIFGIGGIDDAEDADVIIHEYSHAVSYSVAAGTNIGNERASLDEAFSDYFAVSYKKETMPFGSEKVYNWDGNNPSINWTGRTVNNPDNYNYNNISSFGNIYKYTTLWNDAVFDIWNQIGKEKTDILMLEMAYGFTKNMSYSDAALMMIDADTALFGGDNGILIWKAFDQRGILNWTSIAENNLEKNKPYVLKNNFLSSNRTLFINIKSEDAKLSVLDINGRIVARTNFKQGENEMILPNLPAGMYVVQIDVEGKLYTEKIVLSK